MAFGTDTRHDSKHVAGKPSAKGEDTGRSDSRRRALGKGLESLLPTRNAATSGASGKVPGHSGDKGNLTDASVRTEPANPVGAPREIPIEEIDASPYQTRGQMDVQKLEELTRSIEANGVVQPILVRPLPNGRFQLIAGERRWRASKKAGRSFVPAVVRQVSDQQAMEMTIVENLQRADLNPMEQARAYERLSREFKMTQEQMALRTGKDRTTVANFLRLLRLPESVQKQVEAGELTFGHARTLVALDSPDSILKAAARVVALSMSVRQTENYVQGILNPESKDGENKANVQVDANVRSVQEHLQQRLGLKVRIEDKNGKGRVVIHYSRLEDFDSLLKMLGVEEG